MVHWPDTMKAWCCSTYFEILMIFHTFSHSKQYWKPFSKIEKADILYYKYCFHVLICIISTTNNIKYVRIKSTIKSTGNLLVYFLNRRLRNPNTSPATFLAIDSVFHLLKQEFRQKASIFSKMTIKTKAFGWWNSSWSWMKESDKTVLVVRWGKLYTGV